MPNYTIDPELIRALNVVLNVAALFFLETIRRIICSRLDHKPKPRRKRSTPRRAGSGGNHAESQDEKLDESEAEDAGAGLDEYSARDTAGKADDGDDGAQDVERSRFGEEYSRRRHIHRDS